MKRILALLLVFCMTVSLLPVTAFAADDSVGEVVEQTPPTRAEPSPEETPAETPSAEGSPEEDASALCPTIEGPGLFPTVAEYTVIFWNGTTEVARVKVPEGSSVSDRMPAAPVREGYTFAGWTANGASFKATTAVNGNLDVTAAWTKNEIEGPGLFPTVTEYTVIFWNGTTEVARVKVPEGGSVSDRMPADPVREGYTFTGWTANEADFKATTIVNGDLDVTATWTENEVEETPAETVMVTFFAGTHTHARVAVAVGESLADSMPEAPTLNGAAFLGWNTEANGEGEAFKATTIVSEAVTVYAQWHYDNPYSEVVFKSADEVIDTVSVETGKTVEQLPTVPAPEGEEFLGWNTEADGSGEDFTATTPVIGNVSAFAQFAPYAMDIGHVLPVTFQVLIISDEYPIGYNVGEKWVTTFVCQYSVKHESNAYSNHTISEADINAARNHFSGYTFDGWTKTASKNPQINPFKYDWQASKYTTACNKGDIIYLVVKKAAPATYNLTVNSTPITVSPLGGAGQYAKDATANISAPATYNANVTDNIVHVFTGWTTTSGGTIGNAASAATTYKMPGNAATVTANYVEKDDINNNGIPDDTEDKFTVTYTDNVADEVIFEDQVHTNLLSGTATPAFEGEEPVRAGYVFGGWDPTVAATVTATVTYKAVWDADENGNGVADKDEKFTVTYTDGVADVEVFADDVHSDVVYGTATPAFAGTPVNDKGEPVRTKFVFMGWKPEVAATVTADATYVAQWEVDDNENGIPDKDETPDTAPVYLAIYRNGDKDTLHKHIKLDDVVKGTEYDLSGLEEVLAANYSSKYGYEHGAFCNDGWWAYGDTAKINGYTNIKVMVTDYEIVKVYGTEDGDKSTQWEIFSGKALHGDNLLKFLSENVGSLDIPHASHTEWFKYDAPKYYFTADQTVTGWTNVMVKYTFETAPVYAYVYRNGNTSTPAASVKLGDFKYGTSYKTALGQYLTSLDGLYTMSQGAASYDWDGIWSHEVSNIGTDMTDRTVNGHTNLCTMVWDNYPVYAHVYLNGDISKAVSSKLLGNFRFGTSYKEALGSYLTDLGDLYTGEKEWDGIWSHEVTNIGKDMTDRTVNGYTNLCTMVWELCPVYVNVYHNGDTTKAAATKLLGNYKKGVAYKDILAEFGLLDSLEGVYDAKCEWDGVWSHEVSNMPTPIGDGTVGGWTNLVTMVWDLYPVYANVYADDNLTTPVVSKSLGEYKVGTSYEEILTEAGILESLDSLKQKDVLPAKAAVSFQWNNKWYPEASNIGQWEIADRTVAGWTNLCTMVYNEYPVRYHVAPAVDGSDVVHETTMTVKNIGDRLWYPENTENFHGWYQNSKDFGTDKTVSELSVAKKWELYGYYTHTIKLTYDVNGGKDIPLPQYADVMDGEEATFKVTAYEPTRKGYTFVGWYTEAEGGEKVGETYTCSVNTTLYAHWEEDVVIPVVKTVTLDYHGNAWGVKYVPDDEVQTSTGEDFRFIFNNGRAMYRKGYKFIGWSFDKEGKHIAKSFTAQYKDVEDGTVIDVYAQWEKIPSGHHHTPDLSNPKTSDNSNIYMWVAILAMSAVALIGTSVYCQKKRKN